MYLNDSEIEKICKFLAKTETLRASYFGSYSRGDADSASDLDLLVEFDPTISMLTLVRYKRELESILSKRVDLLTRESISQYIFPLIEKDLKLFYARQ
jgi:uncharacterized protein